MITYNLNKLTDVLFRVKLETIHNYFVINDPIFQKINPRPSFCPVCQKSKSSLEVLEASKFLSLGWQPESLSSEPGSTNKLPSDNEHIMILGPQAPYLEMLRADLETYDGLFDNKGELRGSLQTDIPGLVSVLATPQLCDPGQVATICKLRHNASSYPLHDTF